MRVHVVIEQWTTVGASLAVIVAGIIAWLRWVRPKIRAWNQRREARDEAIGGRPAIYDKATGKLLAPPVPALGQRLGTIDERMAAAESERRADMGRIAQALERLADVFSRLEGHDRHLELHDREIETLKLQAAERVMSHVETTQMLKTIETAQKSSPPDPTDPDVS